MIDIQEILSSFPTKFYHHVLVRHVLCRVIRNVDMYISSDICIDSLQLLQNIRDIN